MSSDTASVYWDASAILSALFTDSHSQLAGDWAAREGVHLISTLGFAEVIAVISRMQRGRVISAALKKSALEILDSGPWRRTVIVPEWKTIQLLAAAWPLRGADLWHLATVRTIQKELPEIKMISFDKRLYEAACGESIAFATVAL